MHTDILSSFDNCYKYSSGQIIYPPNSFSSRAYLVKKGLVKLYRVGSKGKQHIVRLVKEGEIIGYYSQFTDEPEITGCKCISNSVLCELSQSSLTNMFKNDHALAISMLKSVCFEIKDICNSIVYLSQKTVRARSAFYLLKQLELFDIEEGEFFPVKISRKDFASWIGTTQESISRSLADFVREKLIELDRENIKIINKRGLKIVSTIS